MNVKKKVFTLKQKTPNMKYPRVIIVVMGRINLADTSNNGLLLRNLFGNFPPKNVVQIYSGGSNGDKGFFGDYYQLGYKDRRFGRLFFKLKNEAQLEKVGAGKNINLNTIQSYKQWIHSLGKRFLINTGFYEIIFRPRLSHEMLEWVENFRPDIIFSQGYNLTFAWLPLMLSKRLQLPIAYYPTDDWSNNRYIPELGYKGVLPKLAKYIVRATARKLVESASVRIAFNHFMKEEYLERFGVNFNVLMQGDTSARFEAISPHRLADEDEYLVVCTGDFDLYRLPLLGDLDQACGILNAKGVKVRAIVFHVNELAEITSQKSNLRYVHFKACPSHDGLVSVLRGADILFLPERFDDTAPLISLSVSSKAHLFMFSGKPIVVYSDSITGISRYAKEDGWAAVVDKRDPQRLADTFEKLLTNRKEKQSLIDIAHGVATKNHNLSAIQNFFNVSLWGDIRNNKNVH